MKSWQIRCWLGLLCALSFTAQAGERWQGFYGKGILERTTSLMAPDIRAILTEDIPRVLTPEERTRLAGVNISFPLEDANSPMNFYADWRSGGVTVPASSLRFLRDLLAAYAWLSVHGHDLQPVSDYLAVIKYQWPRLLRGKPHLPMEVLGVPENALDEPRVMARFQQLFGTAVVFVLGHELGHIYHRHADYGEISHQQARLQEEEADRFALKLLRRMGAVPIGAAFFFFVHSHLVVYPDDPDFQVEEAGRTHPLSPERIQAIAKQIKTNAARLGDGADDAGKARRNAAFIAAELGRAARLVGDKDVQSALRRIGLSTRPNALRARRTTAPGS